MEVIKLNSINKNSKDREMPYTHLILIFSPIIFITIWILDSHFLLISVVLNDFIPFLIRLILFSLILCLALILIFLSHRTLFHENEPSETLITGGILGRVRHPLYLGILLIYIALIALSISLISLAILIVIFFLYNKMANFEERALVEIFGEQYLNYQKIVPKWIPRLF